MGSARRAGRARFCISAGFCGVSRRRVSTYLFDIFAVTPRHRTCTRGRSNRGFHGSQGLQHDRRSEEHTSELQSHSDLVCRLLLEKKKQKTIKKLMSVDK